MAALFAELRIGMDTCSFLAMDMEESNLLPEHLALLNLRRVCLVKALLDSSQPLSPCNCISSASHGGYLDF